MKILIVDDEILVRRSLQRACASRGHTVMQAEDGQAGIEIWQNWNPDLVFLDILMPKLGGLEVLSRLQGQRSAKVILMSAYAGEGRRDVENAGADLFLAKPFEDIFSVVDKAEELCLERRH